jgi:hypothetical protein
MVWWYCAKPGTREEKGKGYYHHTIPLHISYPIRGRERKKERDMVWWYCAKPTNQIRVSDAKQWWMLNMRWHNC